MNSQVTEFNSVSQLARYLNVSRKTVYDRAKRDGISLNGVYSDDQLKSLRRKSVRSVNVDKRNDSIQKETELYTSFASDLVDNLQKDNSEFQKIIDNYVEQLNTKDSQISKLHILLDQSQQLQLDLQRQLNEQKELSLEHEQDVVELKQKLTKNDRKGFWSCFFGN